LKRDRRLLKLALSVVVLASLAFVAVTWWALESGGVAIVETTAADGSTRSTHVWFVEPDGKLWVEAGTPENPWYLDVQRAPTLRLSSDDGPSGEFVAHTVPGPAAQQRVRGLLREKYGFRDAWVGMLVDSSQSIAVRLVPAGESAP
jgi:hypothetical protein